LFYNSSAVGSDILITCSELPEASLTVSKVALEGKGYQVQVIAKGNLHDLENVMDSGFSSLA
jgi:hypothetical protein